MTCGVRKTWMPTGPGPTSTTTDGSGGRTQESLATIRTGLPTATDIGPGVRRTAGPGLDMKTGAGLRITTAVGFTTTTTGPGVHAVNTTGIVAGGVRRSSLLVSLLGITSVGTRSL